LDTGATVSLNQACSIVDIGDLASPLESEVLNTVCRLIDSPGAIPVVLGGPRELGGTCAASVAALETNVAIVHVSPTIVAGDCFAGVNTCFLGTNGLVPERLWQEANSANATIIGARQIYESGVESAANTLKAFLRDQQAVFWHIDAAVIDSGHAAGSPNLNIGGLSPEQLISILEGISQESRVVGCVVTNVAPTFDKRGLSEFVAAEALVRVLAPRLVSTEGQK
jgi:agmatinase